MLIVVSVLVVVVVILFCGRWLLATGESYHSTRDCLHLFCLHLNYFHFPLFYAGCRSKNYCWPHDIDGRFVVKAGISRRAGEGCAVALWGSYGGVIRDYPLPCSITIPNNNKQQSTPYINSIGQTQNRRGKKRKVHKIPLHPLFHAGRKLPSSQA